jgi:hypothetical protein
MSNWKPAFIMRGESKPCTNGEVYATREEALASAHQRFMVWTMPEGFTAVETDEPVNGVWHENAGRLALGEKVPRMAPEQVTL